MRIKGAVPGTNMAAVKFKNVPEGKFMEPSFVPLAQRWSKQGRIERLLFGDVLVEKNIKTIFMCMCIEG